MAKIKPKRKIKPKKKITARGPKKRVTAMTEASNRRKAKKRSDYQTMKMRLRIDKEEAKARKKRQQGTPDYSSAHNRKILKTTRISKNKLRSGMIVRFSYKGIDVHEPRPLVLILNPRWKKHLHGLALRVLTESELDKLAKMTKMTLTQKAAKLIGLRLTKLTADLGNPERFYRQRLKPFIKNLGGNPYRTYTITGISGITEIDYRFRDMDKDVQKKLAKGYQPSKKYVLKK